MRFGMRRLVTSLLVCAGFSCSVWSVSPAVASVDAPDSPLTDQLVVPGMQPLDEGRQSLYAEVAMLSSPAAVQARQASRTAFENLSSTLAQRVDGEALPQLVDESAGGPRRLVAGARVTGYPTDNAVSVDLGAGRHGVIESLEPIAVDSARGRHKPIDLGLSETGAFFQPTTPLVSVRIPKRLGQGASLSESGLSLTPIDSHGAPLDGHQGVLDGASVLYTNTQADADTLVKPTTAGFEIDTLLRSLDSPDDLFFKVGLPSGASLKAANDGSGDVNIVFAGKPIATVLAPAAHDATGTAVPVTMNVSGDVLGVTVADRSGLYQYPIAVDPQVVDTVYNGRISFGNWAFFSTAYGSIDSEVWTQYTAIGIESNPFEEKPITKEQYAFWEYPTQGESHIYGFTSTVTANAYPWFPLRGSARIEDPAGHVEGQESALPLNGEQALKLCVSVCNAEAVTEANKHNAVILEDYAVESQTGYAQFSTKFSGGGVDIEQDKGPTMTMDTTEPTIEGSEWEEGPAEKLSWNSVFYKNALYPGVWVSTKAPSYASFAIGATASDPGVGVKAWTASSAGGAWTLTQNPCNGHDLEENTGVQCNECDGTSPSCGSAPHNSLLYEPLDEWHIVGQLPEGEDTLESSVEDGVGLKSPVAHPTIKIDNSAPHGISLTGLPGNNQIGDAESQLKLKASATDGSGSTPSSGLASITLSVDGREVGGAAGGCSPGPCTSSREWALNTEEYPAGEDTFSVTATDNAGNMSTENYAVTVHHASPVPIGPGAVNPASGNFSLGATDTSIGAPNGPLTLTRNYSSRRLSAGPEGPLGPQWSMNTGALRSIFKTATGDLVLTAAGGQQSTFTSAGEGRYTPPQGDANLALEEKTFEGATELLLSSNGAITTFRHSSGGSSAVWLPAISEGAGGTNATSFAYQTVGGVTEPTEELASVPPGVSCAPTLSKGCRALTFKYAASTTAGGESSKEWGAYQGRLEEVIFTAWDPSAGEMVKRAVAEYEYDKQGRLRSEWNPQISPALKTIYGYDAEGHVTAMTAPGQQPWLFAYGTSTDDPNPGRLISVTRPSATTPAGNGEALRNTTLPTLSSSKPAVGKLLSVSNTGAWSNSPLTFAYQWEDCNSAGAECVPIAGAVNQSYYPTPSDEGHTLVAQVSATSSVGTVTVSSAPTPVVASGKTTTKVPAPPSPGSSSVWTIDYHVPISGSEAPYGMGEKEVEAWAQHDDPSEATAFFPPDQPEGWPAESYKRATVHYLDAHDREVNVAAPGGGISTQEYNETNDVVRTLSPDNRQAALNAGAGSAEAAQLLDSKSTYGSEGTELLSSLGPQHNVALANRTEAQARASVHYFYDEGAPSEGGPYRLLTKTTTAALVGSKEEEVRTTVNSYGGQNGIGWRLRKPTSTTSDPSGLKLTHTTLYEPRTGNVTETRAPASGTPGEETGYAFEFEFGTKGGKEGQLEKPNGIAVNPDGNLYVLDSGNSRVEQFSPDGKYVSQFGTSGKGPGQLKKPAAMTLDSDGNVWIADTTNHRIEEFGPEGQYLTSFGTKAEVGNPEAIAVDKQGDVWVADAYYSKVLEFTYGYHQGAEEPGYFLNRKLGTGTPGSGPEQFQNPTGVAVDGKGDVYVSDTGNSRIVEYGPEGELLRSFGTTGKGAGQLKEPQGLSIDSAGKVWVTDTGNSRVEEFSATGTFIQAIGEKGGHEQQLKTPGDLVLDSEGNVWIADTGNNGVAEWTPNGSGYGRSGPSPHNTQTIYYSARSNASYPACGGHPEWSGLACQTQPAGQPGGSLPALQVSTYAYNLWDETEKTTSTTGTSTRTTTTSYDPAGRTLTSTLSSSTGNALPAVTDVYNEETGAVKQQTTSDGRKITSVLNSIGQLTAYTDADENTSTYSYDVDGRVEKASDGKGTRTYSYDPTTGALTKLVDSAAGTFTATYDPEGTMTSEGYPNGMSANYSYDATGKAIALEYLKTTNCSSNCRWFADTVIPRINEQAASQASTFWTQAYNYEQRRSTDTGPGNTRRSGLHDAHLRLRRRNQPHQHDHARTRLRRQMCHRRRQHRKTHLRRSQPPRRCRHQLRTVREHNRASRRRCRRRGTEKQLLHRQPAR